MSNEPTNKHSQAHRIWRREQDKKKREEWVESPDPDDVAVEHGEFGGEEHDDDGETLVSDR